MDRCARPKGMPRAEWNALGEKAKIKASKKRFLDFNIHTSQVNTGQQLYGAGQKISGGSTSGASKADASAGMLNKGRSVRSEVGRGFAANIEGAVARSRGARTTTGALTRATVIPMTELVSNITAPLSSAYTVTNFYPIQPGLTLAQGGCMPYLAAIAQQFERWSVEELWFEFRPLVSAFAGAGQTGEVIMCCNYDALTPSPQTQQAALDANPSASGMAYEKTILRLDPKRLTGADGKFVRVSVVANSDLKTYDGGTVYIACNGVTGSGVIGELFVHYVVRLINPRLNEFVGVQPNNAFSLFVPPAPISGVAAGNLNYSLVPASNDARLPAGVNANPLNLALVTGTLGAPGFQFPPGQFLVKVVVTVNPSASNALTALAISAYNSVNSGTAWTLQTPSGGFNTGIASAGQAFAQTSAVFDIMLTSGGTTNYWAFVIGTATQSAATITVSGLSIYVSSV